MNTQTIELDLSKDGLGTNLLRVGQGDKGGTTIKALIYDGDAQAALSGYAAYLEVLLPNKANYYRATATVSGNVATVTVDESKLCSVPGYTDEAYFAFEKSGVRYSTERFAIEILKCVTAGKQPAKNWDDAIDSLMSRGNAAVSSAISAASAANTAKNNADKATSSANAAASTANTAASSARVAASSATEAATDATVAAARAQDIANGFASFEPPSDESVAELKRANDVLATAVSELQDKYVIIGETAYAPASRSTGLSGEALTLSNASVSTETATLN